MTNIYRSILATFLMLVGLSGPALAHSFNVSLVLPASPPQANQFHTGFLLAARQRDAHADETADGHLGGLDVFINVIPSVADLADDTDIVVVFAKQPHFNATAPIMLRLGQSPFAQANNPGVVRFIAAYKSAYGTLPTEDAAQGYNAGWRIETAVRAQSGIDDKALLQRSFDDTARDFNW